MLAVQPWGGGAGGAGGAEGGEGEQGGGGLGDGSRGGDSVLLTVEMGREPVLASPGAAIMMGASLAAAKG